MSKTDSNENEVQKKKSGGRGKSSREKELPVPPDGGYGWVVVAAAFMINVIVDGIAYSYGVFTLELQSYYNAGSGITSMVGSLLNGMYLVSSPLASFLINRYDSRLVTICGSLIATLGFAMSQLSPNIDVLMITYGLIGGLGFGLMYLPAVVSVSFYFEKRRALTTGIVVCGTGVGCFAFAPLFEKLLSENGWKYAMVMVAGITLQGAVFGSLLRPLRSTSTKTKTPTKSDRDKTALDRANEAVRGRKPSVSEHPPHVSADPRLQSVLEAKELALKKEEEGNDEVDTADESKALAPVHDVEKQKLEEEAARNVLRRRSSLISPSVVSIPLVLHGSTVNISSGGLSSKEKRSFLHVTGIYLLADPLFLIPIIANLIAMLGHYIPFFFIGQRSIEIIGSTNAQAAFLLSVIAVTNTLGRVLMGFLADFPRVNALLLHNIAISTSGIACLLSMFCLNYATTCVFAAYFGLCMAAWISLSPIILCELLGLEKLTNAFGILCFVRGISSFAGPPIAGMVYDATKDYNKAFHVGGVLLFIGGSIGFLLHLPYFQRRTYATKMREQQQQQLKQKLEQ